MYVYHIQGIVHPQRALLTFGPIINTIPSIGEIYYRVLNNQLYIELKSLEKHSDVHTLKNNIKNIIQDEVSILSYIYGNGYDVEIIRLTNLSEDVDMVFGIDIPYIRERNQEKINNINNELAGLNIILNQDLENAHYIRRCLSELNKAIRYPIDTGFHCFRAIESLRHLCGVKYKITTEKEQWTKLREASNQKDRLKIDYIKSFADYARHGNHISISDKERTQVFQYTWEIVDSLFEYLKK